MAELKIKMLSQKHLRKHFLIKQNYFLMAKPLKSRESSMFLTLLCSSNSGLSFRVPSPVASNSTEFLYSYYYENRDIPDMTTYKSMRMAFEHLLYPHRDPAQMF